MSGVLASFLNPTRGASVSEPGRWFFGTSGPVIPSRAGVTVTAERAMRHSAVFACVKVLAEDIAKLPLRVYRKRPGGGREQLEDSQLDKLLHERPNRWQTPFQWKELMMVHVLLRGNAFSEIIRGGGGDEPNGVRELVPLHPDRVVTHAASVGILGYEYRPKNGEPRVIAPEDMWHLPGLSTDGLVGVSVVTAMAETVGLSIAAERHGGSTFRNGAQVPFVIMHPGNGVDAFRRLQDRVTEQHSGSDNAGKVMFLEEGMTVDKLGMTGRDSQFLETREFQVPDIARFFRVPPHKIQDLRRATFSNIEHQAIEYVGDAIQPWATRFEQTTGRCCLDEGSEFFVEFAMQALLRGDMKARGEFYSTAINAGWMNRNEPRQFENMNPGPPELDEFLQPMSMKTAGEEEEPEPPPMALPPGAPPMLTEPDDDEEDESASERVDRLRAVAMSSCRRLVRQEQTALVRLAKKHASDDRAWVAAVSDFYVKQSERIVEALGVSLAMADEYGAARYSEIKKHGVHVVEAWGDEQIMELYELVGD